MHVQPFGAAGPGVPRFSAEPKKIEEKKPEVKQPPASKPVVVAQKPAKSGGKILGWLLALSALANVGQFAQNRFEALRLERTQQGLETTDQNHQRLLSTDIKEFLAQIDLTKAKVTDKVDTPVLKKIAFSVGEDKYTLLVLPQSGQYRLEANRDFTNTPTLEYFEHGYNAPNPPDTPALLFSQSNRALANLGMIQSIDRRESRDAQVIALAGEHLKNMETQLLKKQ